MNWSSCTKRTDCALLIGFASTIGIAACGGQTGPLEPTPPPRPQGPNTLHGVAYEHTAAEIRPLGGLPLRIDGRTEDERTSVTLDAVTEAMDTGDDDQVVAATKLGTMAGRILAEPREARVTATHTIS
jgi:hypothetical protein